MNKVTIAVDNAEKLENEASQNFIDAWHRAESGESFQERALFFESWDVLSRVLTGKRMELRRYVHRHNVPSVRALAEDLARDYSTVHADGQTLVAAGLLETGDIGVRADYDTIKMRIAIYVAERTSRIAMTDSAIL